MTFLSVIYFIIGKYYLDDLKYPNSDVRKKS